MDELQVFHSDTFGDIRIVEQDGQPWFVAADVCRALDVSNSRDAVARLDEDEKGVASTDTLGGNQTMTTVSEPGLYALVLGSRKPEARQFKRWVTHEIIPAIRKHGAYMTRETIEKAMMNPDFIIGLATKLKVEQETLAAAHKQIAEMKPKAEFFDTVANIEDCLTMREAAKLLGVKGLGQNRLFKLLRDKGVLMENNEPYQAHVNAGHFRVVERVWFDNARQKHLYKIPIVTQRGLAYLRKIV